MTLYKGDFRVYVDWTNAGDFTGPDDDVTTDLILLDIAFGSSPEANPERPVLRPGFGRLALTGSKYIAGRPGSLSDAQLRVRHLIEVRHDAVPLWRGWAQEPRRQNVRVGGGSVSWKLEGLLSQGLRKDVVILNNEGTSRDADTLETWAAAVGADPPTLVTVPPVDLSLYNFMGLGGRYVSEFARVAGGFPVARRDGIGCPGVVPLRGQRRQIAYRRTATF